MDVPNQASRQEEWWNSSSFCYLFYSEKLRHPFFFFFRRFYLFFMRHTETVTETGAEGEAEFTQAAQWGTWTWDFRTTWAEGRCSTTEPPRCPECLLFTSTQSLHNITAARRGYDPSDTLIQVMIFWQVVSLLTLRDLSGTISFQTCVILTAGRCVPHHWERRWSPMSPT